MSSAYEGRFHSAAVSGPPVELRTCRGVLGRLWQVPDSFVLVHPGCQMGKARSQQRLAPGVEDRVGQQLPAQHSAVQTVPRQTEPGAECLRGSSRDQQLAVGDT